MGLVYFLCLPFKILHNRGAFIYFHAYLKAFTSGAILCISACIKNWVSTIVAHQTWPVGSCKSYALSFITLQQIQKLSIYLAFQFCFLWYLDFRMSFVFLLDFLSLVLFRFIAANMWASLNISIDSKEDVSPEYLSLGCNRLASLWIYTSLPTMRKYTDSWSWNYKQCMLHLILHPIQLHLSL